jgi:DNA-binding CsgD family transcriptional regulator/tetratricopeptide (TPR) repeat protein
VYPYAQSMLVARAGLSPVMVGRSAELDQLAGLIGTAGAPRIALIAGEPGIGKTRLLREFVTQVPADTLVLAGQAETETRGRPLVLFADLLDGIPPADADSELATTVRDPDLPADARIQAAVDLVRGLTAGHRAVLVFEDLHWADPESLVVFERLAEPDGRALLLLGTYRPDGLSRRHPASELLPRLERRHSVTHLHLERLTPTEVGNFLHAVYGEPPSFRLVNALHTRTGGNPFFLEELIASSPSMPCEDLDSMPLPWTMAELVRAQLDELDPEVRRIVTAASELGRRVSFDILAAVTGTSEDQLIDLLRAAVDGGLLVEIEPDVFGFHHEIAREAIAAGMLGRERRRLHEAALDALRRMAPPDQLDHAALARHARGAGRFDEMVEEARVAAHSLLNHGSSYQALQMAECGLEEAEADVDLLAVASRAAWLAGLVDDAASYCRRWLRLAREADDVSQEAAALSTRVRVAYEQGDLEAMGRSADGLVDLIDRLPTDEERAQAMATIAQSYMLRDQVEASCEWADKARELAEAHGLTRVRLAAMVEKGSALIQDPASVRDAQQLLETAIEEAGRAGEHVLAARALNNLLWRAIGSESADEVRHLIDHMRSHEKAAGWLPGIGHTELLAMLAAVEGDLDAAIGQVAAEDVTIGHMAWKRKRWIAVLRAGFALEVGDLEAATRYTAEAKPVTTRTAPGVLGLDVHLACRRGDLVAARAGLAELLVAVEAEGYASPSATHDIVTAALRAGLAPAELRPLVDLVGSFAGNRLEPDHPWRQFLDAQLAEAEGRIEDAAYLYAEGAVGLSSPHRSGGKGVAEMVVLAGPRGTVHVGAARCFIALGELDQAREHAVAAARDLARWRGWRVDELRSVERRLGLGAEPSGPDALTPRERDVAALLAEGLTNSLVAERLFISPRTAAVHVSNILAKLGMSSRTEVAAWVAGGGLDTLADRATP